MQKQVGNFVWDNSGFLGEGSYGKVYKGKNIKTGELVAVKCMDMSQFTDQFMKESLENEIQVMKELHSENVVRMYHVESDKKTTYIILELCGDGDLRKFIHNNNGNLPEGQSLEILNQLMVGFKELVDHGYIHRDIKPENTLVKSKVFKVADFGFACKADISGRKLIKDCVGTPLYMAPQLLENHPYTSKSDLWSIGMMFYEMLFGKTPWPARDINSYLRNMKTCPLRFPYDKPIGQNTKDFITRCLTLNENQRLSWEEVFKHPVLKSISGQQAAPQLVIDQQAKVIIRNMQHIVQTRNLNTEQIFKKFDENSGGSLNNTEFYRLVQDIDSRISFYEAEHLFKVVDASKDGSVSLEEFKSIFNNWDFSDINDQGTQVITDLQEIIKHNNLSLKQIFQNFDKDKQGTLDLSEFQKLIKVVAPKMKDYEIDPVFKKFDLNGDGQVSFEEFYRQLAYGIKDQDSKFNPSSEKAKKLISELKRIIKNHNLNLRQIFTNFDKSKDGKLSLEEFNKLVLVIDKNLPQEEAKAIFDLFNTDGDSEITFEEFSAALSV